MNILSAKARGYFLIVTGFLACPCHLPISLPFLLALTAGNVIAAFIANNVWLIVVASTIYFLGALALGWRFLTQDEKVCSMPSRETSESQSGARQA